MLNINIRIGSQTLEDYKRQAKKIKKLCPDIPLMKIQHEIACCNGFKSWSDFRKKFSTGRENIPIKEDKE